jgi:rod shape determining protein RodA
MSVALIAATITIFAKIEWKTFAVMTFAGAASALMAWLFLLKDYQKQRILTFMDPDRDPLGTGYHIIQSKIAIGSGRIFGKGLFQGTQNTLSFIPEQHTDFIFSVWAEEFGFIGSLSVVLAFMILIIWGLRIAHECRDLFGTILSVGATAMIFWQVMINIGMIMGLLPVVGMPLPFISYGGSSIVAIIICVGLLLNVSTRRFITKEGQVIG